MARPIWRGAVSFGMVSIPVGLYSAVTEKSIRFHQLHKDCGARIKLQKWCPVHEKALSADEIVRGYEISKGKHVVVDDEDFDSLPVPSKHTVNVEGFVEAQQVDPVYFDSTYFLEPEDTGRKPYELLLKALEKMGVAALAKIALRQRESMCLLRATDGRIVLETLHYPDEIQQVEHKVADVKVDDRELKMAESLIELLRAEFKPEQYKDEYRETLLKRIEAKAHGENVQEQPEAPQTAQIIDLFDALKKSLEAAKGEKEPARTSKQKMKKAS